MLKHSIGKNILAFSIAAFIGVATTCFLILSVLPAELPIDDYKLSGNCGELVRWYLTDEGTMYLQGKGAMWDYADAPTTGENSSVSPWYDYREDITALVVMPGITSIGGNAFCKCINLKECTFPDSLREIRYGAFQYCNGLTEIVLPDTVSEIGFCAFMGCGNLMSINIPPAVKKLSGFMFNRCHSLRWLSIPSTVKSIEYGCFSDCNYLTLVFEGENPAWVLNELNRSLFFDDTRVEICYPASCESWSDFSPEDKGGLIFMTPYSGENAGDIGFRLLLGDRITLGVYEQDNDSENGPDPIEWVVWAVVGDKAFLTTVKQLSVLSGCEMEIPVYMGDIELKPWLNIEFFHTAFTQDERNSLQSTTYDEIAKYCTDAINQQDSSDKSNLETCMVGFYACSKSFYRNDSVEDTPITLLDLFVNPVIVVARDGACII